jgi:hypothetical protein
MVAGNGRKRRLSEWLNRDRTGNGRDETISATRNCFNISWLTRFIVERLTQPVHRLIERLLEVNERIFSPDPLLQLFTGDNLTRPLNEGGQDAKRLFLQANRNTMLTQFHGIAVQFIHFELQLATHPITSVSVLYNKNRWQWSSFQSHPACNHLAAMVSATIRPELCQ